MSGENVKRVRWCWMQRCWARKLSPCGFGIEAHHAGEKPGRNIKAHDDTTVPLCSHHHKQLEGAAGPFREMGARGRRELQDEWIVQCQAAYERWQNLPAWF